MQLLAESRVGVEVAGPADLIFFFPDRGDFIDVRVACFPDGEPGAAGLHHLAGLQDLIRAVALLQDTGGLQGEVIEDQISGDIVAVARVTLDDPDDMQRTDRFTHRRPAGTDLLRDETLGGQFAAGGILARSYLVENLLGNDGAFALVMSQRHSGKWYTPGPP